MNEPTPPISGQAAKLTTTLVNDAAQTTLVCTVHLSAKPVYAECCAVTRAGQSRAIGRSPTGWKVDSASAEAYPDGTVRLWLSSYPDGASGTEAAVRWVDFPGAVQPLPPASAGSGGSAFVPAPGNFIRIHEGPFANGQQIVIPLADHGIPTGISRVSLKVTVSAPTIGARGRVGPHTGSSGAAMLFSQTQAPHNRICDYVEVAPGANTSLTLWADSGALSEFFVDILGWEY